MKLIPVCQPLLPVAEKLLPYIRQIDANRYYSNIGPLCQSFEARLAVHFGVAQGELVTTANGTLGLMQALKAMDARPGSLCVMPSWTFVATPAAAMMAGLTPYFIDVDMDSWAITPQGVREVMNTQDVGAVIPVAPFGKPLDCLAWQDFHEETGIPVIIDAAAAFDGFSEKYRQKGVTLPFMVSLHATKALGIGEGAVLVTHNKEMSRLVRQLGNFGFCATRSADISGINSKISEYAAAVGLAALDEWPYMRSKWQELTGLFHAQVNRHDGMSVMPGYNEGWVSCYGLVEIEEPLRAFVKKELMKSQIDERPWWGNGCHTQPAYRDCPRSELPNTEYLASRVLGLPFWIGLSAPDMAYVFESLQSILQAVPVVHYEKKIKIPL